VALIEAGWCVPDILVDVGTADPFLARELRPDLLEAACAKAGQPLRLNRREGYDHSYLFVATFMDNHLRWHADRL
jgi:S-formylglutathione hydrolase